MYGVVDVGVVDVDVDIVQKIVILVPVCAPFALKTLELIINNRLHVKNALATVPSRRYCSLAATVPSRLDGTVAGEATMPSTQSRSRYR